MFGVRAQARVTETAIDSEFEVVEVLLEEFMIG